MGAASTITVPFGSLDANLLATLANEGTEQTSLGHLLSVNLALSHRALGPKHVHAEGSAEHRHTSLDLVAELNGEWRARQKVAGSETENSGGTLVYFAPGLRVVAGGRWSAGVSVGVPVLQQLPGRQHETDLRMVVGIGILT